MTRTVEVPTRQQGGLPGDGWYETHPAYGQIAVHRVQGQAYLYGSDFSHQQFVVVTISESQLNRSLSHDWPFARKQILEVALSEAQWATFVSSFQQGSGVQCTLQWRDSQGLVPALPAPDRTGQFQDEGREALERVTRELAALRAKVAENTAGLPAKRATTLLAHVDTALRSIGDSLPFVAKQLAEHMEKTVERAKVEVHGYVAQHLNHLGLVALGASGGLLTLPAPGTGSDASAARLAEGPVPEGQAPQSTLVGVPSQGENN